MATFVEGPVRVSVPATSANLGPGFDSLGLALSLRDELEAEVLPDGLVVEVEGAGADGVPRDESHLVVRSMRAAFDLMGAQPPGLRLSCRNVIPHARGLGSSSAAIVAGVVLARGLVAGGQLLASDEALFDLAADLEGHPDNVAPAFYGGFVISGRENDHWYAVRAGVDPRISDGRLRAAHAGRDHDRARPAARRRCRTPTRPPTPDGPPCSSPPSPASPSTCWPPPATGCTRTSASPPCPRRWPSCAPARRRHPGRGVRSRADGAGLRDRTTRPTWWRDVPTAGRVTTWRSSRRVHCC